VRHFTLSHIAPQSTQLHTGTQTRDTHVTRDTHEITIPHVHMTHDRTTVRTADTRLCGARCTCTDGCRRRPGTCDIAHTVWETARVGILTVYALVGTAVSAVSGEDLEWACPHPLLTSFVSHLPCAYGGWRHYAQHAQHAHRAHHAHHNGLDGAHTPQSPTRLVHSGPHWYCRSL